MKAGWQTTPFEDCIEPVTYTTKIQRKDFLSEGAFPIVSQEEDLINGRWENETDLFKVEQPLVLFGDHTRSFKYVDFDFVLGADGVKILKPKAFLHPRYFYLQLHTAKLQSLGYARHYRLLKEHSVSYPGLEEQHRIVTLLDQAFADIATAKANAEKNLQNARELFESQRQLLLQAQDGWHEATLAELCNIKHGYAFEGEYFSDSGDHVLLTPGSFFETGGFRDRREKTKYFTGPIPTDYVLNQGDLLVAMTEQAAGLLGSPLLVPESNRFLHNQRLGLVTRKPGVAWTNEFFFHVFNLDAVRKAIHASASGAKVRHTSPGKIGAVKVAFPSTQIDQLRIAAHLEEIEQASIALQSIYRQKLTALDDLKKSLLHQAFSGQLTQ